MAGSLEKPRDLHPPVYKFSRPNGGILGEGTGQILIINIFSLSQSISGPLRNLTDAAKRILEGDTNITLEVETADEIGTLATSFNQMTTDKSA